MKTSTLDMFELTPPPSRPSAHIISASVKKALIDILRRGPIVTTSDAKSVLAQQEILAKRFERHLSMGVHYSSEKDQWSTPQDFFNDLDKEFRFETDVCALPENTKCARYFTPEQNGLAQEWTGTCWMNPPYGRQIGPWVQKAYESSLTGATVVCLVPARTDTKWWHGYATKAEVRYVKGRLKFGGCTDNAPFPCAVLVFRPPSQTKS